MITVNGEEYKIDGEITVEVWLVRHGIDPLKVAVELNQTVLKRNEFSRTALKAGDNLEIITFVGGG